MNGLRQIGKTSFPEASCIQLLKSEEFALFQSHPEKLRERVREKKRRFVTMKVPQLLDEVHYLIQEDRIVYSTSVNQVIENHANLLGGNALRFEMSGLDRQSRPKGFVIYCAKQQQPEGSGLSTSLANSD